MPEQVESINGEEQLTEANKLNREIAAKLTVPEEEKEEENDEVEQEETPDGDEEAEETTDEEEETKETEPDEETKQALQLLQALKGPKGKEVLKGLAIRAGLIEEGQKVTKAVSDDLQDLLTNSLGDQWGFIAEGLAPALQTYFDKKVQEVREQHIRLETSLQLKEAWAELSAEEATSDIAKYEKEIDALSNKYQMGPNVTIKDYLRDLYKIASADKKSSKAVVKAISKIEKNSSDRLPRSSEVGEKRIAKGSQLPSLEESIKQAFEEETRKLA